MPRGGRLLGSGWGEPPPNFLPGVLQGRSPRGRRPFRPPTPGAAPARDTSPVLRDAGNPATGCPRRVYPLFPFHSLKRPINPFSSNQRCRVPFTPAPTPNRRPSPPHCPRAALGEWDPSRGGGTDAPSSGGKSESTTVVREPTPGRAPFVRLSPPAGDCPGGVPPPCVTPLG
jgi:hypothetical protein